MSRFSETLRKERRKQELEKKDNVKEVAEEFGDVSLKLIRQFLTDVQTGQIVIDDTADLTRLFSIFLQVNDLADGNQSEGTGQLPKLSKRQSTLLEENIGIAATDYDEETEEETRYIDLDGLDDFDEEDVKELIQKRGEAINKDNEEERNMG